MVFHWSLSDSKSPQVSRALLSIMTVLSNAVIWIVSTRLPTSKFSRPFNCPLLIVPKHQSQLVESSHSFFNSLARSRYLSFFSHSCQFYSVVSRDNKIDNFAKIRWFVYMLKSHWSLSVSFFSTDAGLCIYHFLVWSNFSFLHISQWITLLTQSCLVLYPFCANLLHSLIMWLIVSSLSPHSLHLLFYWVLSILTLIWLVLMALSCAAIRRDSVSLSTSPFLG